MTQAMKEVKEEEITWVLTVPAVFSDLAKQFMRQAAIGAGFPKGGGREFDEVIFTFDDSACRRIRRFFHSSGNMPHTHPF